ncbi:hypothetical protein EYF80_064435 [Liparis tanakae]|uniref:Uncharacterized protein n=1 Tax=Liparis tanakae TaxID=230148 RepID=A0A4Z2E9J6_9TELE|nr:hypothetical protein EYF80_064435 [Liparis tanakae]
MQRSNQSAARAKHFSLELILNKELDRQYRHEVKGHLSLGEQNRLQRGGETPSGDGQEAQEDVPSSVGWDHRPPAARRGFVVVQEVCSGPGEAGLFLKAAPGGSILRSRVTLGALPGSRRPPAARVLKRIAVQRPQRAARRPAGTLCFLGGFEGARRDAKKTRPSLNTA